MHYLFGYAVITWHSPQTQSHRLASGAVNGDPPLDADRLYLSFISANAFFDYGTPPVTALIACDFGYCGVDFGLRTTGFMLTLVCFWLRYIISLLGLPIKGLWQTLIVFGCDFSM